MRFNAIFAILLGLSLHARAANLDAALTTTHASDDNCNPGPKTSAFKTTDASIFLYVSASNTTAGDRLTADWIRPDGAVYTTGAYDPLPAGGSWCFDGSINVAGNPAAGYPGAWTIRGRWNGAAFFTVTFTLSTPGSGSASNLIQNPGAEQGTGTADCQVAGSVP